MQTEIYFFISVCLTFFLVEFSLFMSKTMLIALKEKDLMDS